MFSIIYHSRSNNVESLAEQIAIGIKSAIKTAEVNLISASEAKAKIEIINNSDAIIFGSPTYFGSISSEMKSFFDSIGEVFIGKKWQNKVAAAFTNSGSLSGDKLMTLMQIIVIAMQNGMIWVGQDLLPSQLYKIPQEWSDLGEGELEVNRIGSWLGLMAQSDQRKGIELSHSDFLTARLFGKRIATVTSGLRVK
jgi:NAD(P)H dehydrogenase (quinone)